MDFIRELRKVIFDTASQNGIITEKVATNIPVSTTPLNNCIELITDELLMQYTNGFASVSVVLGQRFEQMVESGVTIAIASQFDNNNTMQLKPRSIKHAIAFSFHINFHLTQKKEAFSAVYKSINDFVLANEDQIREGIIDKVELLNTLLLAGALIGIEFCNRIEIRKEDFLAIHNELIVKDDELNDLDYEDEEFDADDDDEVVEEDEAGYSLYCPFCAQPNLFQPKKDKGLTLTEISFCDHLALGFISNADKNSVGIDYYTYYLKQILSGDNDDVTELSDLLNKFYTHYDIEKEAAMLKQLSTHIPEHKSAIKQFEATIEGTEHRFVFHYIKLLKQTLG